MAGFLFFLLLLAVAAAVAVPIIVIRTRRQARERKNYERGLKMVPMLIHLPPISEDTDIGGRDVRELMDENISKAQIVYNIIASTYEKGFKRKLYGQQHFAFEVLSTKGFVYLYTTVPVGLVEVVRQAIVSAYPSARLEEAEEHNIFNVVGKMSGTAGGELVLKEKFAYPIATYQDLKRDAMQALLNALSTMGKEDGAAIQILLRPADPGWRKTAHDIASSKRKGEDSETGAKKAASALKEIGMALVKPPEGKDGGSDKPKELSSLEQQVLDSIDDKTRYPAYEVLIRIVVSSNISQRSQAILNNIVASFSLFDAPGKNGFKYEPAKDMNELVTAYIMKFFPQLQTSMVLNSVELATIFHFPDQRSIPTTQLERQDSKQVDGPRNMPDDGLLLGYNVFRGVKKPIRLALGDRQRHMYVVGQTGTGKSTFLENLALQDMLSGNGFAFVDPHGDTAEKLLSMVPRERTEDVIYFCPADMEYPMGLNLFEFDSPDQKDFLIQEALNMLKKLYDPGNQGIMGPRYEHLFRNAALTVMADPAGGTFIDIPKLFRDPQYVKQKLVHVKDLNVLEFWQKEMPQSQRSNEFGEVVSWFVSKFGAFLSNEMMRNIIGQNKSAFKLRDVMDNKKILLVNLSKGRLGDLNAKLLGMIFVMKFQAAAMSRANIPESQRVDFSLYVDEFQNFSTDSFATIMSEARKYHLNLIVANQFTTQLTEEIRDAVFGNMGTIVAFRIGQNDVESLGRYFQPTFDGDDLLRVPNYNSIIRTLVGGVPTQPFSMSALPPLGEPNAKLADALKQLSAAKYGRPKAGVEKEIFERISTKADASATSAIPGAAAPPRPFGAPAGAGPGASPWGSPTAAGRPPYPAASTAAQYTNGPNGPAGQPAGGGSFLDEWLAKRGPVAAPTVAPSSAPVFTQPTPVMQEAVAPAPMPLPHTPQPMVVDHANDAPVATVAPVAVHTSTVPDVLPDAPIHRPYEVPAPVDAVGSPADPTTIRPAPGLEASGTAVSQQPVSGIPDVQQVTENTAAQSVPVTADAPLLSLTAVADTPPPVPAETAAPLVADEPDMTEYSEADASAADVEKTDGDLTNDGTDTSVRKRKKRRRNRRAKDLTASDPTDLHEHSVKKRIEPLHTDVLDAGTTELAAADGLSRLEKLVAADDLHDDLPPVISGASGQAAASMASQDAQPVVGQGLIQAETEKAGVNGQPEVTIPELITMVEPAMTAVEPIQPTVEPPKVSEELTLPGLAPKDPSLDKSHFQHGDTIYIDQEGHLNFAGGDSSDEVGRSS